MSREERESNAGVLRWFAPVIETMEEPLCLLVQAMEEPGDYEPDEYERYQLEAQSEWGTLTPEGFRQSCHSREYVNPWLTPQKMRAIINDFLHALAVIEPADTWWYEGKYLIPSLQELLVELENARRIGVQKLRFGYG